jgi:hypothetical protein
MNQYTELRSRLSTLGAKRPSLTKQGYNLISSGGVVLGISLLILISYLVGGSDLHTCGAISGLSAGIGAFILGLGITLRLTGRSEVKKLDAEVSEIRARIAPLEKERDELLARIRAGDFAALEPFAEYTLQMRPMKLMPSNDVLQHRPQKGETCFAQIENVPLGRRQSRTVTRKTGGGYRIAGVYVPVQKERVQVTEMNTIDKGTLAITDRRILYLGGARKLTTKLDSILELEAYQDALAVTKEGRQSADFFLKTDGELLAAILDGIETNG